MNGGSAPASPSKNDIRKKSLREDRDVLPTSSMDHDSESTNSMVIFVLRFSNFNNLMDYIPRVFLIEI
jgi:hypothetical protein